MNFDPTLYYFTGGEKDNPCKAENKMRKEGEGDIAPLAPYSRRGEEKTNLAGPFRE